MSDLTDEQLERRLARAVSTNESEFRAVILEVQRHRAMVKRLEEWAAEIEYDGDVETTWVAAELRNRMRTL